MINILGINISTLPKEDILKKIGSMLSDKRQHMIVTPNPEFLVDAGRDEEFFYILNQASLAVPDGSGLVLAARLAGEKIRRVAGSDLIEDICKIAADSRKKVFFLGGDSAVAEAAAGKLKEKFPDLLVAGTSEGLKRGSWEMDHGRFARGSFENDQLIAEINRAAPEILFVAFGHPRQEKWIFHNLNRIRSVKAAVGIGGGLDFISGKIKRAPELMQKIYLEWLWRLTREPWRFGRIFKAVVIFPLKFLRWRFVMPHQYRKNIVCLLYKKDGLRYKIFTVERTDQPHHWQIPQGGTDGQRLKKAGARELREEIGTDKFVVRKILPDVYRYDFGAIPTQKHTGYKGQKQSLCIAEFIGVDADIKINFWDHLAWRWIDSEELVANVHKTRQESAGIFIEKFKESIKEMIDRQPKDDKVIKL